jgi:hypothetical protein
MMMDIDFAARSWSEVKLPRLRFKSACRARALSLVTIVPPLHALLAIGVRTSALTLSVTRTASYDSHPCCPTPEDGVEPLKTPGSAPCCCWCCSPVGVISPALAMSVSRTASLRSHRCCSTPNGVEPLKTSGSTPCCCWCCSPVEVVLNRCCRATAVSGCPPPITGVELCNCYGSTWENLQLSPIWHP